jgi:hypothetical protein
MVKIFFAHRIVRRAVVGVLRNCALTVPCVAFFDFLVGGEFVMSKRASRLAPERTKGVRRLFCIRTSYEVNNDTLASFEPDKRYTAKRNVWSQRDDKLAATAVLNSNFLHITCLKNKNVC